MAKRELLFQKANENLDTRSGGKSRKQVNETRSNLVIYQYQRQMMEQKMDTIVTESHWRAITTKTRRPFY